MGRLCQKCRLPDWLPCMPATRKTKHQKHGGSWHVGGLKDDFSESRLVSMKRASWAVLATVISYWEFRGDLDYWLPAWGAVYGGQVIGQAIILGVLAAIVFGSAVFFGYRVLGWILD